MQALTIMNNASAANIQKLLDIGKILGIQLRWDTTIESMDFEKSGQKSNKRNLRQCSGRDLKKWSYVVKES